MDILFVCAQTVYVALAAVAANSLPPVAARFGWLQKLAVPIDGGATFRGHRVFGDHKTVRGFVVGIPGAIAVAGIQFLLYTNVAFFRTLMPVDLSQRSWLLFGFLMGLGTLLGDAVKSFFKRQVGKQPGESWFPWDQLDSVIGALALTALAFHIPLHIAIAVLVLGPTIHMLAETIGYRTGLRKRDTPASTSEQNNTK